MQSLNNGVDVVRVVSLTHKPCCSALDFLEIVLANAGGSRRVESCSSLAERKRENRQKCESLEWWKSAVWNCNAWFVCMQFSGQVFRVAKDFSPHLFQLQCPRRRTHSAREMYTYNHIMWKAMCLKWHNPFLGNVQSLVSHRQDNASPHKSKITVSYLQKQNFYVLRHTPYRKDLAQCEFGLFSILKQKLAARNVHGNRTRVPECIWNVVKTFWTVHFKRGIG